MNIKAVAFDMDGTLLNKKHEVSAANKKAIADLQAKGIEVILASGRAPFRMKEYAKDLNVRYIISLNGAEVIDLKEDKRLKSFTLENSQAKKIFDYSVDTKSAIIIYQDGKAYTRKKSLITKIVGEAQGAKIEPLAKEDINGAQKILLASISKSKVLKLKDGAKFLFKKEFEIVQPTSRSVEFTAPGVSKAQGLTALCKVLKLNPEDFAVFGDGGNDVTMFEWAKYGVAMNNACGDLKRVSTHNIGHHSTDAIADFINAKIKTTDEKIK